MSLLPRLEQFTKDRLYCQNVSPATVECYEQRHRAAEDHRDLKSLI
jgi:hypothetical protein